DTGSSALRRPAYFRSSLSVPIHLSFMFVGNKFLSNNERCSFPFKTEGEALKSLPFSFPSVPATRRTRSGNIPGRNPVSVAGPVLGLLSPLRRPSSRTKAHG